MANANNNAGKRLQELRGSGYEIADGEPDIRGWDIKDPQGKTVGKVDELIFDVQSREVRYIVADLEKNDFNLKSRKVLLPIGTAEVHEKDDDVILSDITTSQLEALPEYQKGNVESDTETDIRHALGGASSLGMAAAAVAGSGTIGHEDEFYNHQHFNQNNLYKNRGNSGDNVAIPIVEERMQVGKKTVETGGARVQTSIVEKPVEETVKLREEHVIVERIPVNRPATDADLAALQDKNIELTEHAEVPVVAKEARVVEEINIGKEVQEREQRIRDTVRKTEVGIENVDDGTTPTDSTTDRSSSSGSDAASRNI